jgi:hydrogenase/urease accessory protein HupE
MHAGTAVHIWGILATEQGHAHGTLLPSTDRQMLAR